MQKRRNLIVPLVVLTAVAASRGAAVAGLTIGIGVVTTTPGALVQVPISMTGAGSGIGGLQLDLALPQVLTVSDPTTACALPPNVPGEVDTASVPGGIRLLLFDRQGKAYANSTLVTCTFAVAGDAPWGGYTLNGSNLMVSDSNGSVVTSTVAAGRVSVCTGCCP